MLGFCSCIRLVRRKWQLVLAVVGRLELEQLVVVGRLGLELELEPVVVGRLELELGRL